MEVWYDEPNQREKISYFNDTDYTVWDLKNMSHPFKGVYTRLI